jgi:hypothetical protein
MIIDLRIHRKLYHALYSDVFLAEGRVYKVFKKSVDPHFDSRALTIFEAQCDAFARAAKDAVMAQHTPAFYGCCVIRDVVGCTGDSIGEAYRLNACYVLEKLTGKELKVNDQEILENYPYVATVRKHFGDFGIDTGDASVFRYEDPVGFKLIDITTKTF